ncbi:hypothetical protein GLOIN_2v1774488 [Rhizophagus irregularis DAOM 181602=DAOM 197198]|uniref:Uncharacterized protein n=1 Tax=Rhizophagus irregularis (strain DAOM 181602 / DAOM 197198 / MUCL 43194) TaxID=747089 RepID=A0A2P4Q2B1_RHIID|nr:hypothetical protein GLOIN_2v1774488 [Rhizophagus irregularis DAOM 181602=DAOM 197198]POG71781.1 hypothetical protein GLOIN_2v1774488 [Rhizophagus irregularis DAOM 181602=DAOM 197198]|eukprot:XP_025178647.1 hypothetical protein GLOIN_2v1774488 [Rhizophagus irregularis DAOM 181602=DAOM 197198]
MFNVYKNSKTVQCKCNKQVKLDKTYRVKNLETHASGSGCLFQNGTNKGQFSILNFVKRPLEIDENTPVQISPILYMPPKLFWTAVIISLSDDKYLDYILLTPTQYGGGKRDYIFTIFSINCERKTWHPSGICINCQAIRDNAHFKRALIEIYRSSVDGQEAKIWLELAELGQKGAFNSNKTFTELVNLMIKLKNLEERDKKKWT